MRVGFWLGVLGRRERLSWGDLELEKRTWSIQLSMFFMFFIQ